MSERELAWDMYFAAVVTMQVHPGAGAKGHRVLTLEECAEMADRMLAVRDRRSEGESL